MSVKLAERKLMTIEEFQVFVEDKPDHERWELIDGVAVMSPSPTYFHQVIATNIDIVFLMTSLNAEVSAATNSHTFTFHAFGRENS